MRGKNKLKLLLSNKNFKFRVTNQITDLSEHTAKMVCKQEKKLGSIELTIDDSRVNAERGYMNIRDADYYKTFSQRITKKIMYIVLALVLILLILAWLIPK
jgi:t-SNARE complex subunit (syntaxin)